MWLVGDHCLDNGSLNFETFLLFKNPMAISNDKKAAF